jgi:NSS family neurotransmitter:Na+ symporter
VKRAPERSWSSSWGFVLATIGSATGLGSIWKFPYEVGENGGGGFLLFYLLGLVLIVLPLLLAELAMGRRGEADVSASLARLAAAAGGSRHWVWAGRLAIGTGVVVLSYYAVIGGLTIAYLAEAGLRGFAGTDATRARVVFAGIAGDPLRLGLAHAGFLLAAAIVVARGISGGIEAACRILMPMLLLLLLALAGYAAVLGDLGAAARFTLLPRPEALSPGAALNALGLGFFSIGVGLGVMLTYAAHARRGTRLGLVAGATLAGDTAISLLAAFAVLPIVFALGLDPAEGPALMFLTLPIAFARLPLGDLVAAAFFLALAAAAIASAVSMLELAVAPVMRRSGLSRPRATLLVALGCWMLGLPSMLSFNLWSEVHPLAALPGYAATGILDALDGIASNVMLPVSGLLLSLFAGHVMGARVLAAELGWRGRMVATLGLMLRWVVPALILLLLLLGHVPLDLFRSRGQA